MRSFGKAKSSVQSHEKCDLSAVKRHLLVEPGIGVAADRQAALMDPTVALVHTAVGAGNPAAVAVPARSQVSTHATCL